VTGPTGLLQISDPHFGTEVPQVVDALAALAAELEPSLVVMSGDITQRATAEQFSAARDFLQRLSAPASLVVPGNHDVPLVNLALRALAPYARFNRAFGPDLEPIHDDDRLLVIGVNTVMPIWHQQGAVSTRQTERVCRLLRQSPATQIRIVVGHHPVHVIRPEDDKNLLRGVDDAVPRWVEAGADLVLGGHIHLPYFRPLRHRFPHLPRRAWVAQAGTSVSSRIRSGICNSVNYLRLIDSDSGAACCRVERWDYSERLHAFRRIATEDLTLDR
jgi:3',5'-cyclic AMP phosphodiesterase CpdA